MKKRSRSETTGRGPFEVATVRLDGDEIERPPRRPPREQARRGSTTTAYILTAEADPEQSRAVVVHNLRFEDLRNTSSANLPIPISPVFQLHNLEYSIDDGTDIRATPLGGLYQAERARTVLVAATSAVGLWAQVLRQTTPKTSCPTGERLTGDVSSWIGYYDSRAGARAGAWGIIPRRAQEAAEEAFQDYQCPPACPNKTHGRVHYVVTKVKTHRSNVASVFYLQAKYYAEYEFTWSVFVRCT